MKIHVDDEYLLPDVAGKETALVNEMLQAANVIVCH